MKLIQSIIALALVVIAFNTSNFSAPKQSVAAVPTHRVVEVVDKFSAWDGRMPGFVVQDGPQLQFVHYDTGSMFDRMQPPRYISIYRDVAGHETYIPIGSR